MVGFAIQPPVAEFLPVATYLSAASSSPLWTPSSVPPLAQCAIAYQYESTNTASRYYESCTSTPCAAIKMDAQQMLPMQLPLLLLLLLLWLSLLLLLPPPPPPPRLMLLLLVAGACCERVEAPLNQLNTKTKCFSGNSSIPPPPTLSCNPSIPNCLPPSF